jgi:hypothetical protein
MSDALRDALARLWPLIEASTKDRVFTAQMAGVVGADMQIVRAYLAETQRSSHANGSDEKDDPVAA